MLIIDIRFNANKATIILNLYNNQHYESAKKIDIYLLLLPIYDIIELYNIFY